MFYIYFIPFDYIYFIQFYYIYFILLNFFLCYIIYISYRLTTDISYHFITYNSCIHTTDISNILLHMFHTFEHLFYVLYIFYMLHIFHTFEHLFYVILCIFYIIHYRYFRSLCSYWYPPNRQKQVRCFISEPIHWNLSGFPCNQLPLINNCETCNKEKFICTFM